MGALLAMIVLLTFMVIFILVMSLMNREVAVTATERLQEVERFYRQHDQQAALAKAENLEGSFYQRVIQPFIAGLDERFQFVSSNRLFAWVEEKLKVSGLSGKWDRWEVVVLWAAMIFTGAAIGLVVAVLRNEGLLRFLLIIVLGGMVGALLVPAYFHMVIQRRQQEIQRTLPDVLDLLTVSVEAGLSFDGALVKLAEKMKGALVDELTRVLQEMRIGIPRKAALTAMAKRCNVEDLSLFVSAIVQADQLGVGIAKVLRIQSVEARDKRRMKIKEQAMKAPIKMLFPLVFFIFPALFVVVLGPAIFSLTKAFSR